MRAAAGTRVHPVVAEGHPARDGEEEVAGGQCARQRRLAGHRDRGERRPAGLLERGEARRALLLLLDQACQAGAGARQLATLALDRRGQLVAPLLRRGRLAPPLGLRVGLPHLEPGEPGAPVADGGDGGRVVLGDGIEEPRRLVRIGEAAAGQQQLHEGGVAVDVDPDQPLREQLPRVLQVAPGAPQLAARRREALLGRLEAVDRQVAGLCRAAHRDVQLGHPPPEGLHVGARSGDRGGGHGARREGERERGDEYGERERAPHGGRCRHRGDVTPWRAPGATSPSIGRFATPSEQRATDRQRVSPDPTHLAARYARIARPIRDRGLPRGHPAVRPRSRLMRRPHAPHPRSTVGSGLSPGCAPRGAARRRPLRRTAARRRRARSRLRRWPRPPPAPAPRGPTPPR